MSLQTDCKFQNRKSKKVQKFNPDHQYIEKAIAEFKARGGKIDRLPYQEFNWLDWSNIEEFFDPNNEPAAQNSFESFQVTEL